MANFKQRGSAGIKVIQFSPFKKNMLGAGSENGSVYIWDCNTRSVACSFPSFHNSPITGLAFSAVNHMLMCTGGLDQRINFYDTQDKKLVKTIDVDSPLTCISFCSDGHTLAGGTLYGTVLLFDLRSPVNAKNILKGHEGNAVNWLDFAKSKDIKAKSSRDVSKEPVSAKNEENTGSVSRFRTVEEIKLEAKLRVEQKRRERQKIETKTEEKSEVSILNNPPSPISTARMNFDAKEVSKSPLIPSKDASPIPGPATFNFSPNRKNSLPPPAPTNPGISTLSNANPSSLTPQNLTPSNLTPSNIIPSNVNPPSSSNITLFTNHLNGGINNRRAPSNEAIDNYEANHNTELLDLNTPNSKNVLELVEKRLNYQDDEIFEIKEDIQNLHVEMIRQFMIQMVRII